MRPRRDWLKYKVVDWFWCLLAANLFLSFVAFIGTHDYGVEHVIGGSLNRATLRHLLTIDSESNLRVEKESNSQVSSGTKASEEPQPAKFLVNVSTLHESTWEDTASNSSTQENTSLQQEIDENQPISNDTLSFPMIKEIQPVRVEEGKRLAFVAWQVELPQKTGMVSTSNVSNWERLEFLEAMFSSALFSHPGCRLVVLTDRQTVIEFKDELQDKVEIFRTGVDPASLNLAKFEATIAFLQRERQEGRKEHKVFLDSDILVVQGLMDVFRKEFDVALTWRPTPETMQINAGLVIVHGEKALEGERLFSHLLQLFTTGFSHDRWYGDQLAMMSILKYVKLPTTFTQETLRVEYNDVSVLLLPAIVYNCKPSQAISESKILHFKGRWKAHMREFWNSVKLGVKKDDLFGKMRVVKTIHDDMARVTKASPSSRHPPITMHSPRSYHRYSSAGTLSNRIGNSRTNQVPSSRKSTSNSVRHQQLSPRSNKYPLSSRYMRVKDAISRKQASG